MWDLIAYHFPHTPAGTYGVTFIQVKKNCRPTKTEMKAMRKFPAEYKELWLWQKGKKEPTIEQIKGNPMAKIPDVLKKSEIIKTLEFFKKAFLLTEKQK